LSEIVNLRRARKEKTRAAREEKASENRIKFGAPKKERTLAKARNALDEKTLNAHRLGLDEPPKNKT
jgi:hypothetical protein